ncbi:N-acetylneuraminate lyase [Paenibacillus castaneae]|uniref:dihydrodipicolinate synthase family protein n=1 Tax=Paenibacillus castaneae TaxID=474957 RepID=UPI000C9B58E6|nr:dihydrodipicolinate synthase family protein [Paenibacillus castaneae]NIK75899.1 N-acetylneuraminate lyase [Paenibacillus castaneae]
MTKYDLNAFKGIIPAMNAVYDENGIINSTVIKQLARHYAEVGVQGLYLAGSTGEGPLQSVEERKQVLEAVVEEVGNEITIIAHIGAPSTQDSVELARHAAETGAHAISAVPCIYYRLNDNTVERHWQAIIDSTDLPFIAYHIPATTGYHLSKQLLRKLAAQDKVIGVKITTESAYELQQFKQIGGENFILFNGPDEQFLAGRTMGAEAGIGGTYGIMPELFLKIDQCFNAGNMKEAQKWQFIVNDIITELLSTSSLYGACKEMLRLRGFETGLPRMPLPQLRTDELPKVSQLNDKIIEYIKQSHS